MSSLFPRLRAADGRRIFPDIKASDLRTLEELASVKHEDAFHAPTGGAPISDEELERFQAALHKIAQGAGYPGDSMSARREFDAHASILLPELWPGTMGDALRAESWAFVATILVPHLVKWRFPSANDRRYCSDLARNAIGRLWLTGILLDRGRESDNRWELVEEASEDFLVSVVDRSSISGYPPLARAIAEAWLKRKRQGMRHTSLEKLNRKVAKSLRFRTTITCLEALDASSLNRLVEEIFEQIAEDISSKAARDAQLTSP